MSFSNQPLVVPLTVVDGNGNVVCIIDENGVKVQNPNGSYVWSQPSSESSTWATTDYQPGNLPNHSWESGYVVAYIDDSVPNNTPILEIGSPGITPAGGGVNRAYLYLYGGGDVDNGWARLNADTVQLETFWPSGAVYIANNLYKNLVQKSPIGVFYWVGGTTAQTPATSGAETAMSGWSAGSSSSFPVEAGKICRLRVETGAWHNDTALASVGIRIRSQIGSLSAQSWGYFRVILGGEGANVPGPFYFETYVKNSTDFVKSYTPGLTCARVTGNAVSHALYGDSGGIICRMIAEEVGTVVDDTVLANIAIEVA